MSNKISIPYRWIILILCFIVILINFTVSSSFPVFYPRLVEAFGWSRANTALMYSINSLIYGIFGLITGSLVDRFGPRRVIPIGGLLLGGGVALCSLANSEWHFYLFFGVIAAIGMSFCGWVPIIATLTGWFRDKLGLVFGLLAASFGVSLICAPLIQYLISTFQWQTAYLIIGIFIAVIIIPIGTFFIRSKSLPSKKINSTDRGKQPDNESTAPKRVLGPVDISSSGWTFHRLIKEPVFWMFFLIEFLSIGFAVTISVTNLNYLFQDIGYDPMAAASIFGIFGFAFMVGNIITPLSDRFGREKVFTIFSILCVLSLPILFIVDNTSSTWLLIVFSVIYGIALGILSPIVNASIVERFGSKSIGYVIAICNFGYCLGNAISPWLAGFIHDKTGSYFIIIAINIIVLALGAVFFWLAAPRKGTLSRI